MRYLAGFGDVYEPVKEAVSSVRLSNFPAFFCGVILR